jgi:hypothetical protein
MPRIVAVVVFLLLALVACNNPTGSGESGGAGSDDTAAEGSGSDGDTGTGGGDASDPGAAVADGPMGGSIQTGSLDLVRAVTTFAGSPGETGTEDGTGDAARFLYPKSITTDGEHLYLISEGSIDYVSGTKPYYIRKVDLDTAEVTTLVEFENGQWSTLTSDGSKLYLTVFDRVYQVDAETGASTELAQVSGATFLGATTDGEYLYLTEEGSGLSGVVYRIGIASGTAELFVEGEELGGIEGITTNGSSLFVADPSQDAVLEIDIETQSISTLASAMINVAAIATDGETLYVAGPTASPAVGIIDIAAGTFSYLIGHQTGMGSADGDTETAQFSKPGSFTTDGEGLYLTDGADNHTVRKID